MVSRTPPTLPLRPTAAMPWSPVPEPTGSPWWTSPGASILGQATEDEREHVIPNHLGNSAEFVLKLLPSRNNPRGILSRRTVGRLTSPTRWTIPSASSTWRSFEPWRGSTWAARVRSPSAPGRTAVSQRQNHLPPAFMLHSCHPDGHVDGLTYDIEADGIGVSPVDNRTLRGILDTAPFKWEGTNPEPVAAVRPAPLRFLHTPRAVHAGGTFGRRLLRHDDPTAAEPLSRPVGAALHPAQRRGKALFERIRTNDGREIPRKRRCVTCHFPPYFTDRQVHDVGTKQPLRPRGQFDIPHLNNIYDSAPYLHNGMADTLEEIWTVYNPDDTPRRHQRHDQGSAQRSDRIPQDAMRRAMNDSTSSFLALAVPQLRGVAGRRRRSAETAFRVHEMEAVHRGGRAAQRSHLRGEGRRPPRLGRHRGRPGPYRQANGQNQDLDREGRPPLACGHGHRRGQRNRRRLAGAVRRRAGPLQRGPLRSLASVQQRPGQRCRLRRRGRE